MTIAITLIAGAAAVALITLVAAIDEWQRDKIADKRHADWKAGVDSRNQARVIRDASL